MGWRGNFQAAISLIERLYDSDDRVQQTAVNALCNLKDDRVLDLLLDRLANGPLPQKRIILFNLWRFRANEEKVAQVYLEYLEHEDPDLRFDALVCLRPLNRKLIDTYRKCLDDKDCRIRELALKRLAEEAQVSTLKSFRAEITSLLTDSDRNVKKAAMVLLKKMRT